MRTIGPGSIASLLKIALDVAYAVLWAVLVIMVVAFAAALLALPFLASNALVTSNLNFDGRPTSPAELLRHWPMLVGAALAIDLYVGVLLVIFFRVRQVFATLTLGDPFQPENVGRLRIVGLGLIALEVMGYIIRIALLWALPVRDQGAWSPINISGWFAILVVFVLAEVFREGARLRRDAELTI